MNELAAKASAWYRTLSQRERVAIVVMAILGTTFALYLSIIPIVDAFAAQSEEIKKVEQDLETASVLLEQFMRVKARRDEIEAEYKSVEFKEGDLSYLERLVREKMGLGSGAFTINQRAPTSFGDVYEQSPSSIKFATTSLESLLSFLTELSYGAQPLLVTRLDISKTRGGERLDVDVDVSSIRRVKQ